MAILSQIGGGKPATGKTPQQMLDTFNSGGNKNATTTKINELKQKMVDTYNKVTNKSSGGGNGNDDGGGYTPTTYGGSGGDVGGSSSGGGTNTSTTDYGQYLADYYSALKNTIEKQRQEQERLANAKYEQLVQQANDNYNSSINNITKNNAYTNRWLNQNYGGTSGQGLSNKLRANTNYENNLYSAKQDLNSALLNAQTDKYNSQAEATNNYLSNYNNYLTSPLSSMLSNVSAAAIDDGSYKKYLNKLWG